MDETELDRIEHLLGLRRWAQAESRARDYLAAHDGEDRALRQLALALRAQGHRSAALAAARAAVRSAPDEAWNHVVAADLCAERGLHDAALAAADAAVELAPHHWLPFATRANILRLGGHEDREQAVTDARQAVRAAPQSADAHNVLGLCLGAVGRREEERKAYEEALRIDPLHVLAKNNLAAFELNRGRLSAGRRHLVAALAEDPQQDLVRRNYDALLIRVLARSWWMTIAVGFLEVLLLDRDVQPWARFGVFVALTSLNAWVVRRLLGHRVPGGWSAWLRMVRRMPSGGGALISYWVATWGGVVLLAVVPVEHSEPAVAAAGVIVFCVVVTLLAAFVRTRARRR
jgi:tetratricopeptide (TPR) repeat protein